MGVQCTLYMVSATSATNMIEIKIKGLEIYTGIHGVTERPDKEKKKN